MPEAAPHQKEFLEQAGRGMPCLRPWTSLEEHNIGGKYKPCCYTETALGRIPKAETGDPVAIFNDRPMQQVRAAVARGDWQTVCPPECMVPPMRQAFGYSDYHDYEPGEYAGFDSRFRENREMAAEAIRERAAVSAGRPLIAKFHPSNLCNLRCIMCLREGSDLVQKIGPGYLESIFAMMPYLEELSVFGGEFLACPTSRRVALGPEIRQYPQIHYTVSSNAALLDADILDQLSGLRFGTVMFSLDGSTAPTYEAIRVGAKFGTTMANVERFARARQEGNIRVKTFLAGFVIQKINYAEIPGFVKMAGGLGMKTYFKLLEEPGELIRDAEEAKAYALEGMELAEAQGDRFTALMLKLSAKKLAKLAKKNAA